MRFGKTLVIQEVDNIEPILYPVLRKDLISQGMEELFFEFVFYVDFFCYFSINSSV